MFIRQMVFLRSNLIKLTDFVFSCDDTVDNNWNHVLNPIDRGTADSYFKSKSREVMKLGY